MLERRAAGEKRMPRIKMSSLYFKMFSYHIKINRSSGSQKVHRGETNSPKNQREAGFPEQ